MNVKVNAHSFILKSRTNVYLAHKLTQVLIVLIVNPMVLPVKYVMLVSLIFLILN